MPSVPVWYSQGISGFVCPKLFFFYVPQNASYISLHFVDKLFLKLLMHDRAEVNSKEVTHTHSNSPQTRVPLYSVALCSCGEPGTRTRSGSGGRLRRTPRCRAPHNEAPCQSRSARCAENLHPSRNMGEGRQPQITVLAKNQRREKFPSLSLLTHSDGRW